MVTEEQVQNFKYKMRELMKAHMKVRDHGTNTICSKKFQQEYRDLLRIEDESEELYLEITGKQTPVNFIEECDEHMLLLPWCRDILNQ